MTYTNFGRYDMELSMWRRENKQDEDAGYGKIPDALLVSYGIIDVLVAW